MDSARREAILARFWAKVAYAADLESCWLWTSSGYVGSGYGGFWLNGRNHRAHRIAYLLFCGPLPDDLDICHTCDVRRCVRPTHLYVATNAKNLQDAARKNRLFRHNSTLPRGVRRNGKRIAAPYRAEIKRFNQRIYLGVHPTVEAAAHAVSEWESANES